MYTHPYSGTSTVPGACLLEIESYVDALRTYYAAQGEHLAVRTHARLRFAYSFFARIADYLEPHPQVFERFSVGRQPGGNHCHLNCVGIPFLPGDGESQRM